MIYTQPPVVKSLRELNGKILSIRVHEPRPDFNEFYGYVYAFDMDTNRIYVLDEWHWQGEEKE